MAEMRELYNDIRAKIGDIPLPAAIRAIRLRARDLADQTFVWKEKEVDLSLRAGVAEVYLYPPTGTSIVRIENVNLNGGEIDPTSIEKLEHERSNWRNEKSTPQEYFYQGDNVIRLIPAPVSDRARQLTVRYSVRPTRNGTYLGEQFLDDYYETLLSGALAELFGQNANTWADKGQAEKYEILYREGLLKAENRGREDHTKRVGMMQYGGY